MNKPLRVLQTIYTPVSLLFIITLSWKNYSLFESLLKNANATKICLTISLWGVVHMLSPLLSKTILSASNPAITYRNLLQIHAARLPARYIPGGIWHTVGRISDLRRQGVDKNQLTILVAAESIIPCLTTFMIGGGYLWLTNSGGYFNFIFGLSSLASLILLLIIPKLFSKAVTFDARTLGIYFKSILITIILWLVASIAFTLYYLSFPLGGINISPLKIGAGYMFSWGVGFIAIFAPQGVGVFEFVAGNILKMPTTLGGSIVILAGFRLIVLLADLTTWSACHYLLEKKIE